MTITILIADDQPLQRMGMSMFLAGQDDIEVIGEAGDGDEAVQLTESREPDVVLMDVRMPGTDGIAATRAIMEQKNSSPFGPKVLLLTTFDLDEYVLDGLQAGASGFLTKDAEPGDLLSAIRAVAIGDAVIAPSATRRLISRLVADGAHPARRHSRVESTAVKRLTAREREILVEIGHGATNSEIAARFVLAESTVKNYVGRIFTKIDARDRVNAVIIAFESGLIGTDHRDDAG
ncbi:MULTISPECIES: response regulator transcription factor [unclassified Brevibacterium]|uniref:response regulator n=1 Tax=unclassified Brevibacterium TaxID=2614124 RepID=UPI0010F5F1B4|nr:MULTISPECIES: response regulator transcription factor [unclassified Brevibacterium]MCM1011244.1 response regulator transcription factor [Brevibacterium sp. XM4083]